MGRFIDPENSLVAHLSGADWLILLAEIVILVAVTLFSTADNAVAVAFLIACFAQVALQRWNHRKDARAPMLVAIVAAVQIPAIFLVHFGQVPFSIVSLVITAPECAVLWVLLNWIERRFPRSGRRESSPESAQPEPGSQPKPGSDLA